MDNYVTAVTVKTLRENSGLTQAELAEILSVSDKTVSKWETGRGLPDVSLIEPLAKALKVSVMELMSGERMINTNVCANVTRGKIYVCPICGNTIFSMGKAAISCCGVTLPPLTAETAEISDDTVTVTKCDGETYIKINHEMTKAHHISFIAYVTFDKFFVKKLYPEGEAEAYIPSIGSGKLFFYCNRDGLFSSKI